MKYFLDTEFIEDGKTIDLISIGIVCEDGREYYAINKDCNLSKASDWVQENVINQLPDSFVNPQTAHPLEIEGMLKWKDKATIAQEVAVFLGCRFYFYIPEPKGFWEKLWRKLPFVSVQEKAKFVLDYGVAKPEIWAYYADYDWVAFCQLFGKMIDLPQGFPMYCRDIKQECDRLGNPELPKQVNQEHNALEDARWVKQCYEYLKKYPT